MTQGNNKNRELSIVTVFGATGQQGGATARALLAKGVKVRAFVRSESSAAAQALVAQGAELYIGDFEDHDSMVRAIAGSDGVFSVQPSSGQGEVYGVSDEQEIRYGKAIADISVQQGVKHLVYTSSTACGKGDTKIGHFETKNEIEAYIKTLDIAFTILRPAAFMELVLLPGMGLDQGTLYFLNGNDEPMQFIAAEDIGNVTAQIFLNAARYIGKTIELAGDTLTGNELASGLSQAAKRQIRYQEFPVHLYETNELLSRLVPLVKRPEIALAADVKKLEAEFGPLHRFSTWLETLGQSHLQNALTAQGADIALR